MEEAVMADDVCKLSFSLKRRRALIHRSTLKALDIPKT